MANDKACSPRLCGSFHSLVAIWGLQRVSQGRREQPPLQHVLTAADEETAADLGKMSQSFFAAPFRLMKIKQLQLFPLGETIFAYKSCHIFRNLGSTYKTLSSFYVCIFTPKCLLYIWKWGRYFTNRKGKTKLTQGIYKTRYKASW